MLWQNTWESKLEVLIVDESTKNAKIELTQSVKLTTGFISVGTWTSRDFLGTCQQLTSLFF